MGLFHPKFNRDGKAYVSPNWSYSFKHPKTGRRVKGSTGTADKPAATILYHDAIRQAAMKSAGMGDPFEEHSKRPLSEHVADWVSSLRAKGSSPKHVDLGEARVLAIVTGCKFTSWPDISASRVQLYISEMQRKGSDQRVGAASRNHYLQAFKQFCGWMVADRRAGLSPVVHLKSENARTDRRHQRRALEVDELRRLLSAAKTGPDRYGVSGADRALVYQLAAETGLRLSEIGSLTWASFDLDSTPPTVAVAAAYAKNRRSDTLPLTASLAGLLRKCRPAHAVGAVVQMPHVTNVSRMLAADLKAAKKAWVEQVPEPKRPERAKSDYLEYKNADGRYADFHALRHTFITNLARAGVSPKVAQDLARHSDINLTMSVYTHTLLPDRAAALAGLPDLGTEATSNADKRTA